MNFLLVLFLATSVPHLWHPSEEPVQELQDIEIDEVDCDADDLPTEDWAGCQP